MSMIEKFLNAKALLRDDLHAVKDELMKAATEKADKLIDVFIERFKVMITEASDEEFVDFVTSGKLDDDDLNAAIMFRAKAKKDREAKKANEADSKSDEKNEHPIHVIVLGEI